ncbi:MAG: hypothetical protein WC859_03075 [Elusimicrobiota bacterium]|jgi:hypothetical protein
MHQQKWIAIGLVMGVVATAAAGRKNTGKSGASVSNTFYVYQDKSSSVNHFTPSGWMGDFGDIKLIDNNLTDPADGKSCVKILYSGKGAQGAGWVGMFWQHPANNWGTKPGGFDLTGMTRLTFWARGEKGGEMIAEFKMGGITGDHGDSDSASIGPITLSKEWKKYTIDVVGKNMSHIIGGFCWAASRDDNLDGFVIYLDEIRYEK